MVSTLGKRKAAVSSNDLEIDFKDQLGTRRKPEEEQPIGEKSKPAPILVG
jgi:hypothetical protein